MAPTTTETTATRVGWIGLGIMGSRMAANLRRAGFELTVWNRTRETAEDWAREHGATVAATPAEAAAGADVVVTMVVDGPQVERLLLGEGGAATAAPEGLLCIDMSTIAPADARRIGAALRERGAAFVDAPVTGSSPRAEAGTLTIMAGGADADIARARPLFEAMGELIVHVGELGQGQELKVVNNAVSAANLVAAGEALVLAARLGLDLEAVEQVLASGSAGSAILALKAGAMRRHDYEPQFKLGHMLKDVRFCGDVADAAGIPFPAAAHARGLLAAAAGRGHGDDDVAAVIEAIEALAGTRL